MRLYWKNYETRTAEPLNLFLAHKRARPCGQGSNARIIKLVWGFTLLTITTVRQPKGTDLPIALGLKSSGLGFLKEDRLLQVSPFQVVLWVFKVIQALALMLPTRKLGGRPSLPHFPHSPASEENLPKLAPGFLKSNRQLPETPTNRTRTFGIWCRNDKWSDSLGVTL